MGIKIDFPSTKEAAGAHGDCSFTHNERVLLQTEIEKPGQMQRIWMRVMGLDNPAATAVKFQGFAKGARVEFRMAKKLVRGGPVYETYTGQGVSQSDQTFHDALAVMKKALSRLNIESQYPLAPMLNQTGHEMPRRPALHLFRS
ncbi:MAG: hypothetical protein H6868_00875 [Rhodospirillales bacterium]|nr:hypothetical protein [Rhodospirillales bacterium]